MRKACSPTTVESTVAQNDTFTAVINGTASETTSVNFTGGPVSQATSSLTATSAMLVADGATTTTLTVTAEDAHGNLIPFATVTLTATGTGNTFTSPITGTTNAEGVFTTTLESTVAQNDTFTALIGGTASETASVDFTAGAASEATSSLTAAPAALATGGTTTLTVTAEDANGNLIPNASVTLTATGTGNTFTSPITGTTNAEGVFTTTLESTVAQSDTFTALIGGTASETATVNFTPEAPTLTLAHGTLTVPEDGAVALGISETPVNANETVTVTISGIPSDATLSDTNGDTLTITDGSITLTPAELAGLTLQAGDTSGTLTVTATNAGATSAPQTITLNVTPEAPTLTLAHGTLTVPEDGAVALGISETPVNANDTVTVTISGIPSDATLSDTNGDTLTITDGSITLTPAELAGLTLQAGDTSGTLTVTATNAGATSAPQTITLNVTPEAPTLTLAHGTLTVPEDGAVALGISETPVNANDTVTVTISGIPSDATLSDTNGDTLTITDGSITLTPAELAGLTLQAGDTSGTLTVTATNAGATSAPQTITLNVTPEAPTLTLAHGTLTVPEDGAVALGISETPVNANETVTVTISGIPSDATLSDTNGDTLTITDGSITLTPAELAGLTLQAGDTSGTLTVTATNAGATSAPQTITLNVTPEAPTLTLAHGTLTVPEDGAVALGISETPVNANDTVTVTISGIPSDATLSDTNGDTLTITDGSITLTPAELAGLTLQAGDTSGTLTVTATNAGATSAPQTITLNVTPEAPTLTLAHGTLTVPEDGAVALGISETPVNANDTVTVTISGIPSDATLSDTNGDTLTITDGSITLTPAAAAGLTLQAGDTSGTLTVTATNAGPASAPQTITLNVTPEAPTLTLAHGTLTVPEDGAVALGISETPVNANDTVTVTISGIPSDATLSDTNGDTLTITDGSITLTPAELAGLTLQAGDTSGTLTVTATNAGATSAPQTITLNVTPEAPTLTLAHGTLTVPEDGAVALGISETPVNANDTVTVTISGIPSDATLSDTNGDTLTITDGSITLTPAELAGLTLQAGDTSGTLTVTATNAGATSAPQTITLNVTPEAPTLTLAHGTLTVPEDGAVALGISETPVNANDTVTVTISGIPSDATLSDTNGDTLTITDGSITLTPAELAGLTLQAGDTSGTLTVTATNAGATSAPQTITLNVTPEAPTLTLAHGTLTVPEDGAVALGISETPVNANDTVTVTISGIPSDATLSDTNGDTLTITDGSITLTPAELAGLTLQAGDTSGTLTVTATNAGATSAPQTITLNVTPEAPTLTLAHGTLTVPEDGAVALGISETPVNANDTVTVTISGIPSDATLSDTNGDTLTITDGSITLTPAELAGLTLQAGDTSGTLTVTATNAGATSAPQTITLNVTPEAPTLTLAHGTLTVPEDGAVALGISETPVNANDTVTVTISGIPSDATLSDTNGDTLTITDGSITLTPAELAGLTLQAGDTSGTLTVTATNAGATSAPQTITLNVTPEAPTLTLAHGTLTVPEDGAVALGISETPVNANDTVTVTISGIPSDATLSDTNGDTLTITDGSITLTPAELAGLTLQAGDTSGTLTVTATNAGATSAPQTITLNVTPEAPTLTLAHGTLTVPEDGAVALGISETPVNANDTVTVTISGIPSDATLSDTNGDTLTITDGSITLTPAELAGLTLQAGDTSGTLTVTATNAGATSAPQTITLNVTPEAPTLTLAHGTLTVPEDGAVALGISETPVNANDTVTVTISGIPSDATLSDTNGDTLTITDGSITLTPAELAGLTLQAGDTSGTLTVTATNAGATSAPQTITLNVTPEAPTLTLAHGTLTVPEDGAVALGISETPVNANDTVTVTISGIPSDATLSDTNGDTLTITDGSITLTPAELAGLTLQAGDTSGTLTVTATNAGATSAPQTITLNVTPEAPTLTLAHGTLTVPEDGAVALGISETPVNANETVTVTISGIPSDATLSDTNGDTLTITDGSITLTPAELAGLTLQAGDTSGTLTVTATNAGRRQRRRPLR